MAKWWCGVINSLGCSRDRNTDHQSTFYSQSFNESFEMLPTKKAFTVVLFMSCHCLVSYLSIASRLLLGGWGGAPTVE